MKRPIVVYDSQAFDMQVFGGISRYFCEIVRRLSIRHDLAIRFSENYYIHPARRAELIAAGEERLQHYSWDKSVRQTEQTYLKALETFSKSVL